MSDNVQHFNFGPADDVRSLLSTRSDFGVGVCDEQKRSTTCSRVAAAVAHLTQSGRLTTSPTSVELITGSLTVQWRMSEDCSLTVTARQTKPQRAPFTSAPTSTS